MGAIQSATAADSELVKTASATCRKELANVPALVRTRAIETYCSLRVPSLEDNPGHFVSGSPDELSSPVQ